MDDSYLTITRESKAESKVKGSRFIGETFKVSTVAAAMAMLEAVRRREFSATHHCYAWQVGTGDGKQFKYSDDGEPNGTAGKPIYDVIAGRGVTNLLLVVTRYFGGTKLGTGGLARAYSDAARTVMELSGSEEKFLTSSYRFTLAISLYDRWQKQLQLLGGRITDSTFAERVTTDVEIRLSRIEELLKMFSDLTAGRGEVERIKEN